MFQERWQNGKNGQIVPVHVVLATRGHEQEHAKGDPGRILECATDRLINPK